MRKIRELIMAVLLELHYEKDQILESYINEVYLGQEGPRAIHGFALGAQHYFNTPLEQLSLHQQALLIGMVKGPSLYNPLRNPDRAKQRRDVVLNVMAEQGVVSNEHAVIARRMALGVSARATAQNSYPAFLEFKKELSRKKDEFDREQKKRHRAKARASEGHLEVDPKTDPINSFVKGGREVVCMSG